jgi:hypothetical protein
MSAELENLVARGLLEPLAASDEELRNQRTRGRLELREASGAGLSVDSRFSLAYAGIHALTMAALRAKGYRPRNTRQVAFLTLAHTVSLPKHSLTVIARAHDRRNLIEYEGKDPVDEKFLAELIAAGNALEKLLPNP